MNLENKRLYRSRNDKVLAGVCGGLGEYLDVDPVLIRVAWAAMVLLKGFGILLYLIWIFVVPLKPYADEPPKQSKKGGTAGVIFGSVLILLGVIFLADEWRWIDLEWWGEWSWDYIAPVLLMAAGAWFLLRSRDKRDTPGVEEQTASADAGTTARADGKRFTREPRDKKVFGVCGGIGSYLGVDSTIIRILFVALTLMSPPVGILSYIALAIFTPLGQGRQDEHAGTAAS